MNHRLQGNKFRGLPSFVFLLLISLLILIFSTNSGLSSPKQLGMSVFSVFQKGIHGTVSWFSGTANSINELKNLKEQYELTLEKLNGYEQMDKNIEEIKRENRLLKEQLQFSESFQISHIPAEIIAKDPVNLFSSFIINKGKNDGIRKGMPVTAYQDGIIGLAGKVIEAGYGSSLIVPIYDTTSYVASRFQNTRYEGLISGMGDSENHLIMNYVKKTALPEIRRGDLIITSGMKSLYPRGIYIGEVENITSREYNTSLEIEVTPIIDFARLEYVFILTGEKEAEI